ncbi:very short patch repair endonuclease [Pseudomonadota bacterium]
MADFMTPGQRSKCMSRVRAKNTKPEQLLRKALWQLGYRYRLHYHLPGKPDIAFPGNKLVIFVDGCFWHGCPRHGSLPKTNTDFWERKIHRNIERDAENTQSIQREGWTVLRYWGHEIEDNLEQVVTNVLAFLEA